MKNAVFAALLALAAGCGGTVDTAHQSVETDYAEALQTYNEEYEMLSNLRDAEIRRAEAFEEQVNKLFYESGLSTEEAERKGESVAAKSRTRRLAAEAEIAKQQERVDRAKADLDAARARRDAAAGE